MDSPAALRQRGAGRDLPGDRLNQGRGRRRAVAARRTILTDDVDGIVAPKLRRVVPPGEQRGRKRRLPFEGQFGPAGESGLQCVRCAPVRYRRCGSGRTVQGDRLSRVGDGREVAVLRAQAAGADEHPGVRHGNRGWGPQVGESEEGCTGRQDQGREHTDRSPEPRQQVGHQYVDGTYGEKGMSGTVAPLLMLVARATAVPILRWRLSSSGTAASARSCAATPWVSSRVVK